MHVPIFNSPMRGPILLAILAVAALPRPAFAQNQNIVQDSSFETATAGVHDMSNSWSGVNAPAPLGDGVWTITNGQGNVFSDLNLAHSGSQSLDLTFGGPQHGTVEQTLTTTAGQLYNLSFYVFSDNASNTFSVMFNGNTVFGSTTLPDAGANANKSAYQLYTVSNLLATSVTTNLDFTASTAVSGGRTFLDDVSVTAVPEPAFVQMSALLGSGAVGLLLLRRRSHS